MLIGETRVNLFEKLLAILISLLQLYTEPKCNHEKKYMRFWIKLFKAIT